jgi:hypothetical protein
MSYYRVNVFARSSAKKTFIPSLRVTPVIAAGVSDRLWFIEELIDIAIDGRD